MHERLDVELEADVEERHRGRDADVGLRGGREYRQAVADVDARLLAVAHADARVGQGVAVAGLAAQVQRQRRVGDEAGQVAQRVDVDEARRELAAGDRRGDLRQPGRDDGRRALALQPAQADLVGESQAQLEQPRAVDLEHLDLEHDLGLGDVDRVDQPLGQPHRLGAVLDDQRVEPLVDEHRGRAGQRAHHALDLARLGVGQEEGARDQLLVFAGLGRGVGVDQQRVGVERNALEAVGAGDQPHDLVDRGLAHEDRDADVGPHVTVEDEVDAGGAREHLEDRSQRSVAKFERDRGGQRGGHRRRRRRAALRLGAQLLGQAARLHVPRRQRQRLAQPRQRGIGVAGGVALVGQGKQLGHALVGVEGGQRVAHARVAGVQALGAFEQRARGGHAPGHAFGLGLRDQVRDGEVALAPQRRTQPRVTRCLAQALLDARDGLVDAALGHQRVAFVDRRVGRRAAGGEQGGGSGQGQARDGAAGARGRGHHGVAVKDRVWACASGR